MVFTREIYWNVGHGTTTMAPMYLLTFAAETCRAELTHWTTIFMAPFFFLWNKPAVGWIMIIYALCENLPLIIAQRSGDLS